MSSVSPQTVQSTTDAAPRGRIRAINAVSLIVLTAAVVSATWLRFHLIEAKSLWTDEGVSAAFTRLGWYDFARILWRREANMTLYYLLLRAWTHAGDSVRMIRGMSAIFSIATIPAIYAVGKRIGGTAVGLTAAVLLTVNAYSVRYAQEARSYSLVAFLITVTTYFLIRAVEASGQSGATSAHSKTIRDWTWYIATSVLAVYAHFFAVLVVVAHWISVRSVLPPRLKPATAVAAMDRAVKWIALLTLPIWIFVAATGAGPIKWIQRPGAHDIQMFLAHYAGNAETPLLSLYLVLCVLAMVAAFRLRRARVNLQEVWRYALPVFWFVVPVGITLAVSMVRPVFLARYMIMCLPALVLLVAIGLMAFRERWMALPVLALICWFAVAGTRSYYDRDFDISREDYRSAAAYIAEHGGPGDAILFAKGQGRFAYDYYAIRLTQADARPVVVFPAHDGHVTWRDFMGNLTPQMLAQLAPQRQCFWLVLSPDMPYRDEQFMAAVAASHTVTDAHDFPSVRVYRFDPK